MKNWREKIIHSLNSSRDELKSKSYDAIVIGSGPNGLAAAILLAQNNRSVLVIEAEETFGGGSRTAELTLPGFRHDVCSAIHPLGVGSPFFRSLNLEQDGLEWIHPDAPVAHPLPDGTAALLERSFEATGATLDQDGEAWRHLMEPFARKADALFEDAMGPLHIPSNPFLLMKFGLKAIRSAQSLTHSWFRGEKAKALFAGIAAHTIQPLDYSLTAAIGLMLGVAGHAVGWPMPRGGAQSIIDALMSRLKSLGGDLVNNWRVESLEELPQAKAYFFDVAPRNLARICDQDLPSRYKNKLGRFRHGPPSFKVDWALSEPVPWKAKECARAGTVHLGGTFREIAFAEKEVAQGRHAEQPYVLFAQQSLFDSTRAPEGKHTGWGYCHVPMGSTMDVTEQIENQIERFAPGFRDVILERSITRPADFEAGNANYVDGDISGGAIDLWQLFFRPVMRRVPYTTPNPKIYVCSASTPPGAGVHGMCGYHAAKAALKRVLK